MNMSINTVAEMDSKQVKQIAIDIGFDIVGVARAEQLREHRDHVNRWLDDGHHASMSWLAKGVDRRCDPSEILVGCRSVVVVGVNYYQGNSGNTPPLIPPYFAGGEGNEYTNFIERESSEPVGRIAQYAQFADYHKTMGKKAKQLSMLIANETGADCRWYVDTGPILEKVWAQRAGLGFIGKNGCLIHPRKGSYFLLGVILTTLALEPDPMIESNRCGTCTNCLDACPTDAFTEPGVLDCGRCLSYLTIEHRDAIPYDLQPFFKEWLFGCDVCQDVCPYNVKFAKPITEPCILGEPMHPPVQHLLEILKLRDKEQFLDYIGRKSPLRRAGLEGLKRTTKLLIRNRIE